MEIEFIDLPQGQMHEDKVSLSNDQSWDYSSMLVFGIDGRIAVNEYQASSDDVIELSLSSHKPVYIN